MKNIAVERVVKRYLQAFIINDDFIFSNNLLYKSPLEDILAGFCFEKSGLNKDGVYVWCFVQPLYLKSEHIILSYGKRLKGTRGELWLLKNNTNLEETIEELIPLMKDAIDVFLNNVDTPSKFYNYYQDKLVNLRMAEAVTYSAIYSKNKDSKLILENYINILENENIEVDWVKNLLDVAKGLKLIIGNDEAIQNLFQKNIIETKQTIGL